MIFDRQRSGTVMLGLTVALFAVSCNKKDSAVTTPSCTFSIVQPTTTFGPEGGTGSASITVSAGTGCTWTATSSAAFITFTTGSGTGSGTASFTVAPNTGAERTATLTVAGASIAITQRAFVAAPTLAVPTPSSPTGGQTIVELRPTLVATNAVSTGAIGTVTYRFEVTDTDTFPDNPLRTIVQDGIAQGNGTTSWPLPRDLGPGGLYFWRVRATNGTLTTAFSPVATFRTAAPVCNFTLTPASVTVAAAGGSSTITITTGSACSWTAVSNDGFIVLTTPSSGSGNGSITFSVAANTGAARTGTLTVAGQTVSVNQSGAPASGGLVASFRLLDPGRLGAATTTDCWIRSLTSQPTQCTLESTSFPLGTNAIVGYSWVVSYTYPNEKAFTQVGTNPQFSFTDICGLTGSNDSGLQVELKVSLTVTDSGGNSVTVRSNAGNQPLLTLRAYICGI